VIVDILNSTLKASLALVMVLLVLWITQQLHYSFKVVMSVFLKCMLMIWRFTKVTDELEFFGVYTDWQSVTVRHSYILNVLLCNSIQSEM